MEWSGDYRIIGIHIDIAFYNCGLEWSGVWGVYASTSFVLV